MPATLAFDLIYSLVLDETRDRIERREELDAQLASFTLPSVEAGADRSTDRDRRAATWGRSPAQQRAMRRAIEAGGDEAKAGR